MQWVKEKRLYLKQQQPCKYGFKMTVSGPLLQQKTSKNIEIQEATQTLLKCYFANSSWTVIKKYESLEEVGAKPSATQFPSH